MGSGTREPPAGGIAAAGVGAVIAVGERTVPCCLRFCAEAPALSPNDTIERSQRMDHERYMRLALIEAKKAAAAGEIPVGAVVVCGNTVLAAARNDREVTHSPLGHAEVRAIEMACQARGDWRLDNCTLYVTLEPCPMCSGVILNARVGQVVYGAADPQYGCLGSRLNLAHLDLGAAPRLTAGILAEECSALLSDFFRGQRQG